MRARFAGAALVALLAVRCQPALAPSAAPSAAVTTAPSAAATRAAASNSEVWRWP